MKKYLILIVISLFALNSFAQWKVSFAVNDYTDEKYPQIVYDLKKPVGFVRYVESTFEVYLLYSQNDNFDLWWDAQMDNNGWISYLSDLDLNFIGKSPLELNYTCKIENYEKSELYFSFFIKDYDSQILNALKENNKLKIRYYDAVMEKTNILDISLTGVSAQCKKIGL